MNNPSPAEARGGQRTGFREERRSEPERPDLHSQLEELRMHVWACEAEWRLDDRIDLALKVKRRR
jgi:hypothetical protein